MDTHLVPRPRQQTGKRLAEAAVTEYREHHGGLPARGKPLMLPQADDLRFIGRRYFLCATSDWPSISGRDMDVFEAVCPSTLAAARPTLRENGVGVSRLRSRASSAMREDPLTRSH
jgi:hypothetical protein